MNQRKQLYESKRVWEQDMQLGQVNLVRAITDFFPSDVQTALDVGCGDGKVTQAVIDMTGRSIIGLDSSSEALSRCSFKTMHGDATSLPFPDQELDLVMTIDTLEHLPDDIEGLAWAEIFRVASKAVMVAVPFREELLDATARCKSCGTHYHVNWHVRSYDWPALIDRAPAGWKASLVVLTGEQWPPYHPIETAVRRDMLNEWSGWTEAICPNCGTPGSAPDECRKLPPAVASALGVVIYEDLLRHGVTRSYSEIVVLYRPVSNLPTDSQLVLAPARAVQRDASIIELDIEELETNLVPYPEAARLVAATDGGHIVQFPVYSPARSLAVNWRRSGSARPLGLTVEDGKGLLFAGEVYPDPESRAVVELPRTVAAGYHGVLVRLPTVEPLSSMQMGDGPLGIIVAPPDSATTGYYPFELSGCRAFLQAAKTHWVNLACIEKAAAPKLHFPLNPDSEQTLIIFKYAWKVLLEERDALWRELSEIKSRLEVRISSKVRKTLAELRRSKQGTDP